MCRITCTRASGPHLKQASSSSSSSSSSSQQQQQPRGNFMFRQTNAAPAVNMLLVGSKTAG
jgi:hypothetical protein